MSSRQDNEFRPRPIIAIGITGVVVGLSIQDQLSSGSVDPGLLGALLFLAAFWAGQTIDKKWFGK